MKKRFIFFVLLFSVCIALVIPKTNALTLTESTEQQGGGGFLDVCLPFNKYLEFYCNDEVQLDSYESIIYTDTENIYRVYDDGTFNIIECPNGWRDSQGVSKTLISSIVPFGEYYSFNLMSGENVLNRFYLQIDSIVDVSYFLNFLDEFYISFTSLSNDFLYNGSLDLDVYGNATQNYEGSGLFTFDSYNIEFDSNNVFNTEYSYSLSYLVENYSDLIEYYGVSVIKFHLEIYFEFNFDLWLGAFPFEVRCSYYALEQSFPYIPTDTMLFDLYGGDIVEEVINPDFGSWLTSSLSGFMNFEIVDGWSFGIIFALIVAIPIVLYFLKYFFGG